ncbi:hypothetical protein BDZ97DRAFT_620014 [Flammula alnicola]|nr:hypothetical protein BDZ97DRAFT_620014 [Flammula alnicola]
MFPGYQYMRPPSTAINHELGPTKSSKDELSQRITTWLMGIQPLSPSCDVAPSTARSKNRQSKPYCRPERQLHRRYNSSASVHLNPTSELRNPWPTHEVPVTNLRHSQQNLPDSRIPLSRIDFRGLHDLPEPEHNPLVTCCPEDLKEEYCRIIFLYNNLEEKKQQSELRWLHRASVGAMQDLMDIGASIQRVIDAAQYIVDFAYSHQINIDFEKIFLRYRCPPLKQTVDMSQARPLDEEWRGAVGINLYNQ